jgi:hypothetical protein
VNTEKPIRQKSIKVLNISRYRGEKSNTVADLPLFVQLRVDFFSVILDIQWQ